MWQHRRRRVETCSTVRPRGQKTLAMLLTLLALDKMEQRTTFSTSVVDGTRKQPENVVSAIDRVI